MEASDRLHDAVALLLEEETRSVWAFWKKGESLNVVTAIF
jgi:hypothetical protein